MKIKLTKRVLYILVILLFSFFVLGYVNWSRPVSKSEDKRLQITTSFYPLYYFASEIGGDRVNIVNITPAGAEPHDYEPTSQDIIQILNSRVLFLNGGMEPWGQKIKENLKDKNTQLVEVSTSLRSQMFVDEDGNNVSDPHIWLSPVLAKKIVGKIVEALISVDIVDKDYYLKNGSNLDMRLDNLDREYKQGLAVCKQKDFVTSHAAFGYLASTYGLKQIPISGLSPDAEPSLQELAKISTFAKDNGIKYIFFESLVSPKLSSTVAKEIGAQTLVLNPLEGLSAGDLKLGKNYFTEMENNLQNLKIALKCQ